MSTRAIFAKQLPDGTYVGGWQWNDGGCFYPSELNKRFSTEEKVDELISVGEWKGIFSKKEKEEHIQWYKEKISKAEADDLMFKKIGQAYVLLDRIKEERKNKINNFYQPKNYESLDDMLGQDLNFVYVFNPLFCTWKKYH